MTRLKLHQEPVRQEWIDYNGHLSEAYYVLTFGHATDALYDYLDMGQDYRDAHNRSVYTVESHIRYLMEVPAGKMLEFTTLVLSFDEKRLHFAHEMHVDGQLRATTELMGLHLETSVDGGVMPFPDAVQAKLTTLRADNVPDYVGRAIRLVEERT
ncbi:thioesterase family protein [Aestuariispira insulae]|uniref:Acyl-CoA thioester hydrolase n=1 Tax=Aestuariispira insulae TaxID=1461337 RepID=A0A3D9HLF5_9PROT|nr:thioesterase family protein [Aestuariispira insulae]RED49726.1 acyl-CoA thioester hydrolase [Aestuariispira insulae]